jgi:hypothetical protein
MARLTFQGLDSVAKAFDLKVDGADEKIKEMLEAGGRVFEDAWREAIDAAGLVKTGDMRASVKAGKAHLTGDGGSIAIYPRGNDSKGTSNATKAFILHYGTSRIHATRFVDNAEKIGEERAAQAMKSIWDAQK